MPDSGTTASRLTTLAEALFVVRVTTNVPNLDRHALWLRQPNNTKDVFLAEAAAILATLPPDWCGHEAEIARLRTIEEAAQALLSAAFSGDDYRTVNSIPMAAPRGVVRKVRALRATLEADR